jgi:hypothetical protein
MSISSRAFRRPRDRRTRSPCHTCLASCVWRVAGCRADRGRVRCDDDLQSRIWSLLGGPHGHFLQSRLLPGGRPAERWAILGCGPGPARRPNRGVKWVRGKHIKPLDPGWHIYWPLFTEVEVIVTARQTLLATRKTQVFVCFVARGRCEALLFAPQ